MKDFNPALENLMKFTPTDSVRATPVSSYTAHKGWFEVKNDGTNLKKTKVKGAKS